MADGPVIHTATSAAEMETARLLFLEYAASLDFDLCFQGFAQELAELPGPYAPPVGCLLLATVANEPAGCVALRNLAEDVGEMKRLYVRGPHRGTGLGRTLVERVIQEAIRLGYRAIRLDTVLPQMARAVALYRSVGFREIPAYNHHPVPGTLFMEVQLP